MRAVMGKREVYPKRSFELWVFSLTLKSYFLTSFNSAGLRVKDHDLVVRGEKPESAVPLNIFP